MKNHKNIFAALAVSCAMIACSLAFTALAQVADTSASNIKYPIAVLGNCKDQANCKAYCTDAKNMLPCVTFAEQKGLLSGEDLRVSKIVAQKIADKATPGGCTTKDSCETYCQGNVENINECISFGEELRVIPASDLAEAKKIASALKSGAKMPGSCKTKKDCENFCANGTHIDECLNFAEAAGIIPAEELAQARKVAPFLKNGQTPGACTTKASCDEYCANDANFSECVGFAEKAGFISSEEATMAKKVRGKGPGNCKGKDECMNYCNQDEHADECATFAQEKGLLTAEEQALVSGGVDKLISGLEQIPPEVKGDVVACLEGKIGKDKFQKVLAKQAMLTKAQGDSIQGCFAGITEKMQAKMMQGVGAPSGSGGMGQAPSREDIMKNIPDNVPTEMRAQIEAQIESQMKGGAPAGIPVGAGAPPSMPTPPSGDGTMGISGTGGSPENVPKIPTPTMPNIDCSAFSRVPSCDMVPSGTPRDMCVKCKG